ncbi:hypothetical protein AB4Y80_03950 [Specibacter sp. RAF43]
MTESTHEAILEYDDLRAIVVDALRHDLAGEATDHAAHEVLERLRDAGVDIPSIRPPSCQDRSWT